MPLNGKFDLHSQYSHPVVTIDAQVFLVEIFFKYGCINEVENTIIRRGL